MKIVIVTDAWDPQVNGVVTTIKNLIAHLEREHEVIVIEPGLFRTVPFPLYPEIGLTINPQKAQEIIKDIKPDAIHVSTEGPLGMSIRNYCVKNKIPFTTSAHTKFPEYLTKRLPFVPIALPRAIMRWFHSGAHGTLVNTESHKKELLAQDYDNLTLWARGIDRKIFNPDQRPSDHPILRSKKKNLLFVGRVAKAKNIEAFCKLSANPDYQCWVVGDGPQKKSLERRWGKKINFVGYKKGADLAEYYALSDVCVFPSLTDTFGVTLIESMACGTPVAAYPVTGPIDVITPNLNGAMDKNLDLAVAQALKIDPTQVAKSSKDFTWKRCAEIFHDHLAIIKS